MSEVISLRGGLTGEPVVREDVIEALEAALERARAGEVVGIALVELWKDGLGSWSCNGLIGGYSMIGACEMAKVCILEAASDD